jgi:hypothetical protein
MCQKHVNTEQLKELSTLVEGPIYGVNQLRYFMDIQNALILNSEFIYSSTVYVTLLCNLTSFHFLWKHTIKTSGQNHDG